MSQSSDISLLRRLGARLDLAVAEHLPGIVLAAPVFLGLGIGLYFSLRFEPELPLSAYAIGIGVPVLAAAGTRSIAIRWGLLAVACLLIGASVATWRSANVAAPVLQERFSGAVEGRFAATDRSASNRTRVLLDQVVLYGVEPSETPKRVRITLAGDAPLEGFRPGDRILISARLSAPGAPVEAGGFDFRRYAWFRQWGGIGFAMGPVVPALTQPQPDLWARVQAARHALAGHIKAQLPGDAGAFAAAILIGDRSSLDAAKLEDLRASNLAHLLAISGLHMGLVTGFVFAVTRLLLAFFPKVSDRYPAKSCAAIAAIAAGALYLVFSGASIATQRAFIMAMIAFGAIVFARPALTLRAVAIAALAILLMRPESLTEPGFQMSFAATTALVAVFAHLSRHPWWIDQRGSGGRVLRWAAALAVSSATAGLATAPFGAFHFNQVAQYGLIANLLAVPIMGMLVMPALIIALALAPIGLDMVPMQAAGAGIDGILGVAAWVSGFSGSVNLIPKGPPLALALIALGGLSLILVRGRVRFGGAGAIAVALMVWLGAERPVLTIDPTAKLLGVMQDGSRALNKGRGAGLAAAVWLENDGDGADQRAAAARSFFADGGDGVLKLATGADGKTDIALLANIPADCTAETVLVVLKENGPKDDQCMVIDADFVARNGAVSVFPGTHGPRIRTASGAVGHRPWAPAK